jgi:hypothetical protein
MKKLTAAIFLNNEFNGFQDEFNKQEIDDIIQAMNDFSDYRLQLFVKEYFKEDKLLEIFETFSELKTPNGEFLEHIPEKNFLKLSNSILKNFEKWIK